MKSSSTRRGVAAASLATLSLLLFATASPAFAGSSTSTKGPRPAEVANDDDSQVPDPNGDADNRHPSGKDRHEDKGTQGFSASDPDDDGRGPDRSNGGADKPFADRDGSGGVDQGDQDGNNGCGNDDDFEDDNEGWCGHKPKPTHEQRPAAHGQHETGPCPAGTMPSGSDHECKPKPCTEDSTMPSGSERDCDHGDHEGNVDHEGTEGNGDTTCPKESELPAGTTMPAGCEHESGEVAGSGVTTCPEAGQAPTGGTMPAGCLTTTAGGSPVTADTLTPGAVLASQLENGPAAPAGVETAVLGVQIERGAVAGDAVAAGAASPAGASVLGATVTAGAALARTGFGLTMLLGLVALVLLALGVALRRFGTTGTDRV
jgi:hypothetical protein